MTTPTFDVKTTLQRLLIVFTDKIATPANCLQFFNADWCPLSQEISFSHDIETIWVLQRTLTVTSIKDVQDTRSNSEWYAYLINDGHQILQKISPTLGKAPYHTCRMYTETIARLSR